MIGLVNIRLGRKVMTQFVGRGPKTGSYLRDDGSSDKKGNWIMKVYNEMETYIWWLWQMFTK